MCSELHFAAKRVEPTSSSVVNCTNILQAAFTPISFGPKITNLNCYLIKVAQKLLLKKQLVKCW